MNHKDTMDTKVGRRRMVILLLEAGSRRKGFQPGGYIISPWDGKLSLCGSPRKE